MTEALLPANERVCGEVLRYESQFLPQEDERAAIQKGHAVRIRKAA